MKTLVRLTATARRHAESRGLLDRLQALQLETWAVPADRVSIEGAGRTETFLIASRTIAFAADGEPSLIFELDHPPRPPGRS